MILDFIGWNLVALAFLCFVYVAIVQKSIGAEIMVPLLMIFGGLTLGLGTGSIKNDLMTTSKEFYDGLLWFTISFGAITTLQIGAASLLSHLPFNVTFDVMNLKLYGVLIAIAEELCFRGFVLPWFSTVVGPFGPYFGIPISAGAWSIYHLYVYGTEPTALMLVFMVGIILGFIAWSKQRLWIFMGAHALVNLVAMGGLTLIGIFIPLLLISLVVILWVLSRRRHH